MYSINYNNYFYQFLFFNPIINQNFFFNRFSFIPNNAPVKIIRKEITIKTVKSLVEDNIGYIQISSFISQSTPSEFIQALEDTDKTKGLIIDLRGNAGGLLANAVFIANIFITKGKNPLIKR